MKNLEPLTKAGQCAALLRSDLGDCVPSASALEFLLLYPLIERAADLARDIEALRGSIIASQPGYVES